MRLLITGIHWPPETFIQRLIEGLLQAGIELTVGSAARPLEMEHGLKWLRTPSWDASIPVRLARLLLMSLRARLKGAGDLRIMAAFMRNPGGRSQRWRAWNQLLPYAGRRWDIIYFPWNSAAIAHLPIFELGSPVVLSCRGTQVKVAPHNPARTEIREGLRLTFERAAAVHCVSEAARKDACAWGLNPAKSQVIRPAVDTAYFKPAQKRTARNGTLCLLTTGNLIWVKGHEWALQAVRSLVDRGIKVTYEIIGDGPDRQRVCYTIADLGLQQHVQVHGRLPQEQVCQRLQQADVFLLSSLSEGFSNAVLEAMACGVPVVTTDCGGVVEAVTDGVEGLVVPLRDAERMADALQALAVDPSLRQSMGQAGRARIERDFGLKAQIEQWLRLFESVRHHKTHGADVAFSSGTQHQAALIA